MTPFDLLITMSNSTDNQPLQSNVWIKIHASDEDFNENVRIRLGDVEADFTVYAKKGFGKRKSSCMLLCVTTEEPVHFVVNCSVSFAGYDKPNWHFNGFSVTEKNKGASTYRIIEWKRRKHPISSPMVIKLVFEEIRFRHPYPPPKAGLKSYIERGPTVLLVGKDGGVLVPRRALKMHSEIFEEMFRQDCEGKQTNQICLKEFDYETLDAFSHFLATGLIRDGKETALGLIQLGETYEIQDLIEAADEWFDERTQKEVVCESFEQSSIWGQVK